MNKMKYFIFRGEWGLLRPVIFDSGISHESMAINLLNPHRWDDPDELKHQIVGAGFVILTDEGLLCYGRSVTLNLESRGKEDSDLINRMLGKGEH